MNATELSIRASQALFMMPDARFYFIKQHHNFSISSCLRNTSSKILHTIINPKQCFAVVSTVPVNDKVFTSYSITRLLNTGCCFPLTKIQFFQLKGKLINFPLVLSPFSVIKHNSFCIVSNNPI